MSDYDYDYGDGDYQMQQEDNEYEDVNNILFDVECCSHFFCYCM